MQSQSWIAAIVFALIGFGGGYLAGNHAPHTGPSPGPAGWSAEAHEACYFSPRGGCTDAVVLEIESARTTVELEGYSFTSRPIGTALVNAHRRGVDVQLVLDAAESSERRHEVDYVARAGVPVYFDASHAIAHNKVVLIDHRTLITGSFNFTRAAEEDNAENIVILRDHPKLQSAYEDNFRSHLSHSQRYQGK